MKPLDRTYELLVAEYNRHVARYKKARWDTTNPEDCEAHGREYGFLRGLGWAIETLFPEMS